MYQYLDEAEAHGVREVYFTGGEPFLHKQIMPILARSLQVAATSVLTNGTLITPSVATELAALAAAARYSLEMRVSLDGVDEARNDAVRGKGALRRALRAPAVAGARVAAHRGGDGVLLRSAGNDPARAGRRQRLLPEIPRFPA